MSKQPIQQQTRQQQRQEAVHRREEERLRTVSWRQETVRNRETGQGRAALKKWLTPIVTVAALVLALVGLIAFYVIENQTPANPAYSPVGKISCDGGEHSDFHIHAHLTVYVNGKKMTPLAGVGIAPDNSCIYWLHTHNTDGVMHVEAPNGSALTLKNFLDIWSTRFSTLGYPSELTQTAGWQAYVNGKPFTGDFHTIPLQAHALITLTYNSPGIHPDTSFAWNGL